MLGRGVMVRSATASTKVMRLPWDVLGGATLNPADYPWELYDLAQ
jgi:hypothetical protein